MSKNSLLPSRFETFTRQFYARHKDALLDIILFGSTVRGKEKPADVDILLLFKEKTDSDISYAFRKSGENYVPHLEVTSVTYDDLFSHDFLAREGILLEGYSIIKKQYLAPLLNFSSFVLFRYDLKNLSKSKRMLFYYSLYGRKKTDDGMLHRLNGNKLSDGTILVPVSVVEETKQYLASWQIDFMEIPLLIPSRIVQSEKFRKNRKD